MIAHAHHLVRKAAAAVLCAGLLALLAACSQTVAPPAAPDGFARVATVPIAEGDTRAAVEAAYGGTAVVFRPEAGFAVLGLSEEAAGLLPQGSGDANQDAIATPETLHARAAGFSAWAGGFSAWAGGFSAWAGGVSAWAGGTDNPFPGNEDVWSQIGIGAAQDLAANDGAGVKVAVIDTGVDLDHSGFSGRLAPSGEWLDLVDGDGHPDEVAGAYHGHGTAVAGIILQAAPNATILPLRVLGPDGSGDVTAVAQAIDHAVAVGADVINLSLGTSIEIDSLQAMVDYAQSAGVSVIASSGNTGDTNVTYPAAGAQHPQEKLLLGVGSVDAADRKSSFSTYGGQLEMLAPGEGITTLYPGEQTAVVSGTSFAAPWVAGTIALARGDGALYSSVTQNVSNSSVDIEPLNPGYDRQLGRGRLDSLQGFKTALGL